jgi:glycerophosphoryl diester phosphodiesterase
MLARVAHRGYSTVAPENTLPAFAAAVRAGATVVEFDVRATRDGVPAVIHDRTVNRTTNGSGRIWDLTWDEVAALDAGSWFGAGFSGLRVPSLAETLDLLAPEPVELLVEIKPPATLDEVKSIVAQLAERDLLDRTVLQSFDADVVRKVRDVAPEARRGLLLFRFDAETVELCRELGVTWCNPSVDDVLNGPETMAALTAAGIGVMPWTPNDMAQWRPLVDAGVAGLITDLVGELTGWVNA